MAGSAGFVELSTASTTTEPLWRTTSRTLVTPPGSVTFSVLTEKTLPLYEIFVESTSALPVRCLPETVDAEADAV